MQITAVQVIVTCPAGQACTLLKVETDAGVYGVGVDCALPYARTFLPAPRRAEGSLHGY
jgi:hypothetical protein